MTVVAGKPASIEREGPQREFYASCWLLVDYLREGRQGWSENEFPTLVREIGAGHSDRETLETVYRMSAMEIENGLRQHIKDFKLLRGAPPAAGE